MVSTLFESQVVLGANAGEHCDLFATQTLHSSALAVRQANIGRLDLLAAGSQEGRKPARCLHGSRVGAFRRMGDPGITSNDVVWIPALSGRIVVFLGRRLRHRRGPSDMARLSETCMLATPITDFPYRRSQR